MSLKCFTRASVIACSFVILSACGVGEVGLPSGAGGLGSTGTNAGDKSIDGRGGSDAPGKHEELGFSCNPDARAEKTLQRLSRPELLNTVRDLISGATNADNARAVMSAIDTTLQQYPADATTKIAPFATMDQSVSQAHVDALMQIGIAVGQQLTSSADRLKLLVGNCATGGNASSCVDAFIASFGERALRHQLNDAEKAFYKAVYGASSGNVDAQGVADVVAVMLQAPDFVYRVEFGAKAKQDSLFALGDYEIATRLSYLFWQTAPDRELLEAAANGELSSDDGFDAQLDRVLKDPRTGAALEQFAREWLDLDALRPLDSLNGTPIFDAFVGKDKPSATLKEEMIQDLTDSLAYHAQAENGTLQEWLESPYSFAKSQALAAIYETPVWDGKSPPPQLPEERTGLLTRAALLATGSANTRPIMKGVLIRERLLCDELGAPPPDSFGKLPDLSGEKSTRELVEAITQVPGSACATCHATQINPLGFATENFDSLGRLRKTQDLYDANGKVLTSKPIDTGSVPRLWMQDTTPSTGAADLTSMLVDSGKVEACFAREYVRYAVARHEDEQTDGCELEAVRAKLDSGQSILDALKALAQLPQFRQRYVPMS
jgi:hypothetical protein